MRTRTRAPPAPPERRRSTRARTWLAIQSGPRCVYVASAYVKFDAPSTATKISTSTISPVAVSTICAFFPE